MPATSVACRWLAFLCPTWQRPSSSKMASMRAHSLFLLENSALASSTLLVKCLSTTCRVSVIAFFADDLSRTPYRCPPPHTHTHTHTHTQATSKQRTNKLGRCYLSERRFARSLTTCFQSGQPHLHTCVCPLKWEGGKRACTLVAGTQDVLVHWLCSRRYAL